MAAEDDDEAPLRMRAPRYDDEDVTLTTNRELRGWYSTGLAAEIFAVGGVGSFAPVALEQLARESGVLRSDGVTPCVRPPDTATMAHSVVARVFRAATAAATTAVSRSAGEKDQCVVRPFGREMATTSFAMYTFSIAVFVQALVLISFSPVADYGTYRKRLLMGFAFAGAVFTLAMALVSPQVYLLGSLFIIVAVVCLGSTFVLLNSFLPLLAANHPSVGDMSANGSTVPEPLPTPGDAPIGAGTSAELKLSTHISSTGVGLGYAAAVTVQIVSILTLILLKKRHFSAESTPLRFVLLIVGSFWLVFTIPGAFWLRDRPGPSLKVANPKRSRLPAALQYITFAWASVWGTVRTAARLRQTWVFLIAWFLLSDAIATESGTAILFARTELGMSTVAIALLSITATTSGVVGAFFWPWISKRLGLQTKQTIIACMLLMEVIPLYGLLGFVPLFKSWGVIGLQQAWEIYPLGFVHGVAMGGLTSYCRSFYGEIIPPGSEAAFYALYAVTDKGSSAVGPTIVGAIVDAVGTIRPAFAFMAVLVALPIPLIYFIDVQKGRRDAAALSKHAGYTAGPTVEAEDFNRATELDVGQGLLRHDAENDEDDEEEDVQYK